MTQNRYDLESVSLPRLAGRGLRVFVGALENPLAQPLLLRQLLANAGLPPWRRLRIDEPPTFQPLVAAASPAGVATPPFAVDDWLANRPQTEQKTPFPFATVRDYHRAYAEGTLTPVEVAQRVIAAIAASDDDAKPLRAFIASRADDIMAQAEASAARWREGKPLSVFDGVPLAVKDEVDMVPYGTTVGTRFLGQTPAREDATVVARMRAAGALLLGKTNMHEIGISVTGLNPHHGVARNPYDPDHYTGGSSSGSSVAVAAGFCPAAIGADGGGSIRVPAAFCGVVGLKPTFGRVSEFGAAPLDWSVAHLGAIGATAEDVALAYAIMAGPDRKDPNAQQQPPVSLADFDRLDLSDLTMGLYTPWFEHAAPAVVASARQMVDALQDMGASVRKIEIPELDAARLAHVVIILSEMAAAMQPYDKAHRRDFGLDARINLALGRSFTSRDYIQAQRVRTRAMGHFRQALAQVDVIVTPTTAVTAPLIPADALPDGESDLSTITEIMRFAFPANLTGLPAITFPAGYDASGMPTGVQVIGGYWQEALLLRIAHAAEQVVPRRLPQRHFQILDR